MGGWSLRATEGWARAWSSKTLRLELAPMGPRGLGKGPALDWDWPLRAPGGWARDRPQTATDPKGPQGAGKGPAFWGP